MKQFDKSYGPVYAYYTDDIWGTLNAREKKKIPFELYFKIVKAYLTIYFTDLYYNFERPMYFFLGGMMKITQQRWKGENYIKLFWWLKPNKNMHVNVSLKKITRSGQIISKLEKNLRERTDVALIDDQTIEYAKKRKERKLWINAYYLDTIQRTS